MFYVISVKHMNRKDFAFLFWGKNSHGYTVNVETAGVYTKEEAESLFAPKRNIIVSEEIVKEHAEKYVIEQNTLGTICVNNPDTRKAFGICASWLATGRSHYTETEYEKPETYYLHMLKQMDLFQDVGNYLTESGYWDET